MLKKMCASWCFKGSSLEPAPMKTPIADIAERQCSVTTLISFDSMVILVGFIYFNASGTSPKGSSLRLRENLYFESCGLLISLFSD